MVQNVSILDLTAAMASHAVQRHAVISENIANADTPGYKAKDVESFAEIYKNAQTQNVSISEAMGQGSVETFTSNSDDALSPNGNSVSLEDQSMRAAQSQNDHSMALMLYNKSLQLMKIAVGKNL